MRDSRVGGINLSRENPLAQGSLQGHSMARVTHPRGLSRFQDAPLKQSRDQEGEHGMTPRTLQAGLCPWVGALPVAI